MRAVVLCIALLPLAAFAQTSTATAPATVEPVATAAPHQEPRWSLGAGVSFGTTTIVGPTVLAPSLTAGSPDLVPGVGASLERRLSDRTWLVIGVAGAIRRTEQDLLPGTPGISRDDVNALSVSGGARYVLTPARAIVEVSALALVDGGVVDARTDRTEYVVGGTGIELQDVRYDTTGWLVGASFGVAVDRALTGNLSLRVATPLVGVDYSSTRTKISGQQPLDGSDFTASVVIAPRLELRLAF